MEEEKKYIYNDKAERIKKMNRFYIGATIFLSLIHISRFSEEVIIWNSNEYQFVEIDDAYSTGSSIMPQKKNPEMCIRDSRRSV